tara:strand:+ start:367 stop:501 length:135 start_codon:yes stop_codon:yes gene_type:complete
MVYGAVRVLCGQPLADGADERAAFVKFVQILYIKLPYIRYAVYI